MIERLSRAADTRPLTLSSVKSTLHITSSDYDEELGTMLDGLVRGVEGVLGYPLARASWRETTTGQGERGLLLSRLPVEPGSVVVTVDGEAVTDFILRCPESGLLALDGDSAWRSEIDGIVVTYRAGWPMTNQLTTWSDGASISTGTFVQGDALPGLYEATTAGVTGAGEPAWGTPVPGDTVADGSVVWTYRLVDVLPVDLQRMILVGVRQSVHRDPGTSAIRVEGALQQWGGSRATPSALGETDLPAWLMTGLSRYPRVGAYGR